MEHVTNDYLLELQAKRNGWSKEIEQIAKENRVPIMDPLGIQFVQQIIRLHHSQHILEIGTAIGYSALKMLEANPDAKIVTIERDEPRYEEAIKNIHQQGADDHIKIVFGDALEVYEDVEVDQPFDLLFIDAAKGKYHDFLQLYGPMIAKGGIIISDNVLFRGYVANPVDIPKRYKKMVASIREYNDWLMHHSDFDTTIVPIGDGVAISIKNK